jgi:hypothetical protein
LKNIVQRRLTRSYAILQLIDLRRAQTGDRSLGSAIEKRIVERELKELQDQEAATGADGFPSPTWYSTP